MKTKFSESRVSLEYINQKLHSKGVSRNNNPISIDYIPPLGDDLGYTSLELLLLSLASCVTNTILIFLRKMKYEIAKISVNAIGIRKQEHPTGFKTINVELNIESFNLTNEAIEKVIKMSEEQYCPVWSMLKGNIEVMISYKINDEN